MILKAKSTTPNSLLEIICKAIQEAKKENPLESNEAKKIELPALDIKPCM